MYGHSETSCHCTFILYSFEYKIEQTKQTENIGPSYPMYSPVG